MLNIRKSHPLIKILNRSLVDLPTPSNISTLWNFGSLLGLCLIIQIVTGLFLAMHFSADTTLSFNTVAHISRDVNYGWLIRALHANGASFFFICLYIHAGRGIYYFSYKLRHMNSGCCHSFSCYRSSLYRVCSYLGANIILSRYSYYKPTICYPLPRPNTSSMNLRRIRGRQRHPNSIFQLPLRSTFHRCGNVSSSSSVPSPNRFKQPCRSPIEYR